MRSTRLRVLKQNSCYSAPSSAFVPMRSTRLRVLKHNILSIEPLKLKSYNAFDPIEGTETLWLENDTGGFQGSNAFDPIEGTETHD